MEAVTISALTLGALQAVDSVIDLFPNYDQRKRNEFREKFEEYKFQLSIDIDHPDRNDDLLVRLRNSLFEHVQAFETYARTSSKNV
jgi:hypothetical protein